MLTLLLNTIENEEDKNKIEQLYCLYAAKLIYYAESIIGDTQDAEGVVQTAYEKTIHFLDRIEKPESENAYGLLLTVVRNLCYDYLRKKKKIDLVDFSTAEFEISDFQNSNPEQTYIEKESYQEMMRLIDEMPEEYKTVLLLRIVHELSVKEIAAAIDVSANLVSVRLLRAKKYLKKVIKDSKKED